MREYKISKDIANEVSSYKIEKIVGSGKKLGILDMGIRKSLIDEVKALNYDITIFPADTKAEDILNENVEALLVSNGPGNPEDATQAIATVKELLGKMPVKLQQH